MASGDTMGIYEANNGITLTTNGAQRVNRNGHVVWAFDTGTDEFLIFPVMLHNYGGGGLTLTIEWAAATATSGNGEWEAAIERHRADHADFDMDADSFAAVNASGAVAVPGAAGRVKYTDITWSDGADMDSLANTEGGRLKINRNVGVTSDAAGDLQILKVILKET